MKTNDLILIGALGLGAYLLFKMLGQGSGTSNGGGGGWSTVPYIQPSVVPVVQPYVEPKTQQQAVVQAQQAGATVYTRKVGSYRPYVAVKEKSTRAALLTVGTPEQQIQQYNVAPRIVMGRKVM